MTLADNWQRHRLEHDFARRNQLAGQLAGVTLEWAKEACDWRSADDPSSRRSRRRSVRPMARSPPPPTQTHRSTDDPRPRLHHPRTSRTGTRDRARAVGVARATGKRRLTGERSVELVAKPIIVATLVTRVRHCQVRAVHYLRLPKLACRAAHRVRRWLNVGAPRCRDTPLARRDGLSLGRTPDSRIPEQLFRLATRTGFDSRCS